MNEVTAEWVQKAGGDFATGARKNRNCDAVCFHAQQCIEKYLKAFLQNHRIPFPKTHDLLMLLEACLPKQPLREAWRQEMDMLTRYAVLFRYPGESATPGDAARAVRIMRKYREELRLSLGAT